MARGRSSGRLGGQLLPESGHVGSGGHGSDCGAAGSYSPTLTPGEQFSVCVTVTVRTPMLPEFVDATTATGQFVVERDRYVDG